MSRVAALSALALAAACSIGCDAGDPDNEPAKAPPEVHLLSVRAFDDKGVGVGLGPSPTKTVAANTSFRLAFDRFLLPASAVRQSVCLQAKIAAVPTIDDCTAPVSLTADYDPVTREAIYRLQTSATASGRIPLTAGGTYQLTVFAPTSDPASAGFRAFDGALLADAQSFEFKVSSAKPGKDPDPLPTGEEAFCAGDDDSPSYVLTYTCGVGGCHTNTVGGPYAAMGLVFLATDQRDAIVRTALNHVAHETQIGEDGAAGEAAPSRFGRAMPIIDTKSAGNSYALYKALVNPSAGKDSVHDDDEQQRLRQGIVVGNPMPLLSTTSKAHPAEKLTVDGLANLSVWIQAGAGIPKGGVCP